MSQLINVAHTENSLRQLGWTDARLHAYFQGDANTYYYRFLDIGEERQNGAWTAREHKLFMQRVMQVGVNEQWGLFSQAIAGRVGYQCSNHWRDLIATARVKDPMYKIANGIVSRVRLDNKFRNDTTFQQLMKKDANFETRLKKYSFTIVNDNSGVFGQESDLPSRHPQALDQETIKTLAHLGLDLS